MWDSNPVAGVDCDPKHRLRPLGVAIMTYPQMLKKIGNHLQEVALLLPE